MFNHPVLSLIGIAVIAVVAVLIYRSNQKKVDPVIDKVEGVADKVVGEVKDLTKKV